MRSLKFIFGGNPSTLDDVFYLKEKGFSLSGRVEPYVERENREYGFGFYDCDILFADFNFVGWEKPIKITKPYETDFNPLSADVPFTFTTSKSVIEIVENSNRRLQKDIERIQTHSIPLQARLFTHELITRERPEQDGQKITSLQGAIKEYLQGNKLDVSVEVVVGHSVSRSRTSNEICGAVYKFREGDKTFKILKEYMINSNQQYSKVEMVEIADKRMQVDIERLKEAGFKFEVKTFDDLILRNSRS